MHIFIIILKHKISNLQGMIQPAGLKEKKEKKIEYKRFQTFLTYRKKTCVISLCMEKAKGGDIIQSKV